MSTIRDEASYDRGAPALEEVLQGFRDSAATFRALAPPSESEQVKYRQMIADGLRGAEPTGEDMLTLISIKTREAEVSEWMKEFMAVAQEAGAEALRLYGKVDYPAAAADGPFKADLSQLKMGPLPAPSPPPRKEAVGGGSNPLLEHLGSEPSGDEP
ncbi:hypothetical protein [Luteolibacter arcticus]|uniref:hypothetical protein n=1 Tax=Luteolibacter arcticus TaxID=1581411 RepID=UPI002222F1BA|nr:hypothetical protein [Luteolibacter arcticus]